MPPKKRAPASDSESAVEDAADEPTYEPEEEAPDDMSGSHVSSDAEDDEEDEDEEANDEAQDANFDFVGESEYTYNMHAGIVVVKPENRRTKDMLTRAEISEIISLRSDQIANNAIVMTDISGLSDPIAMAKKEFNDRKTPLILRRRLGEKIENDGTIKEYYEFWDVKTMLRPYIMNV